MADAIKTVSGALTKINKKSQHAADQKMVLATHRVAPTTNPNSSRLYLRGLSAVTRTTPLSQDEMLAHSRFTAVSRAVNARSKDLTKIAQDKAAFEAQLNTAGGCKTMKSWYWKVEGEAYDAQH